jgi:hypothetical protein
VVVTDFDADGVADLTDSCPTVVNSGLDADADGVDDACDTCRSRTLNQLAVGPNPPFTGSMTNRTTVSGQLDDDADGIGNACDFDYNNQGVVITSIDFNDMKFSLLPSAGLMSQSTCGATAGNPPEGEGGSGANQRCGEFDHTEAGAVVANDDFNMAKAVIGALIQPGGQTKQQYLACGAPCTTIRVTDPVFSGPIGSGQEILGKAICVGVGCPQ